MNGPFHVRVKDEFPSRFLKMTEEEGVGIGGGCNPEEGERVRDGRGCCSMMPRTFDQLK